MSAAASISKGPLRRQGGFARALMVAGVLIGMAFAPGSQAQIAFRNAAQGSSASGTPSSSAISFVAAGAQTVGTGASITPVIPGGTQANDFAVLIVAGRPTDTSEPAAPAGWTLRSSSLREVGANDVKIMTFYRVLAGGDAAPTVNLPAAWQGAGAGMSGQIAVWSGVDTTTPFDVADVTGNSAAVRDWTPPAITTVTDGTWVASAVATSDDNDLNIRTANGFTGRMTRTNYDTTTGGDHAIALADKTQATAGLVTMLQWRQEANQNDPWAGITFALRPAPGPPTNLVINVPAGTTTGDVMIASITVRPCSNAALPCTVTISAHPDWSLVDSRLQPNGGGTGGNGHQLFVYQRVVTGTEPGSYTWTFGGAPVHAGAAGAILSFSGVDTASPIVAQLGALTASSSSHTAPQIDTGAVTSTVLVSTHTSNSSTTWAFPAGMTERVDISSLPPTDNLGLSLEVNTETLAAAGLTGTRTATYTTPGTPANDTGATHMLALRPLVVIVTPGSFNAFETSTAAGAITGVIRTKVAGSAFSLDVVAIASGAQQAGFTDAVIVELLGNNTLGVSLDAQNCPTSFTLVQTVAPNPTITGGRSTVSFAAVPNSWRDVRVRVRWPMASPTVTSCSTDNFAIRPSSLANFAVTDTDWQTAGTTRALANTVAGGGNVHKAGRPFTVRADAVNSAGAITTNYTGAPTATLSTCAGTACTAAFGTLTLATTFAAGQLASNAATYTEAGSFNVQLRDTGFSSVDSADGTPADCSASGQYVCSATLAAGRFVPDHFAVTAVTAPVFRTFNTNDASCTAGAPTRSFTYIGQRFGYFTVPTAIVTAREAGGGTTANYTGGLWKLNSASVTQTLANSPVMTLDTAGVGAPSLNETAGTGTGTYGANAGDLIAFTRDNAVPRAQFSANLSLTVSVADASEAGLAQGTIATTTPLVFSAIAFDSGNAFRYGRLAVRNANGSQLVPLPVQVEAQYWLGAPTNAFVTNADDNCTSIASANDAMGSYTSNLSGSPTCETAISGGGTLSGGRRTLQLAAPGSGNNGSVNLTVNLGATASGNTCTTLGGAPVSATTANLPYLQGNWTGGAYDQNPSARATFGVFKGAEEIIFVRENF